MNPSRFAFTALIGAAVSTLATMAFAAGGHSYEFGAPGKAAEATRSIEISLADNYYEPGTITVKPGETIRFVLKNTGEFQHEFSIDTLAAHAKHREQMAAMAGMADMPGMDHGKEQAAMQMKHADPNMVVLEPGQTRELVWKFTKAMQIEFACSIPGHYESGMMGRIEFEK